MGRWFRPAGFVVAAFFLLLPFVTVSCDVPGGFGRAAPGGTTTYTGVHLLTGDSPDVTPPEKIRADGQDEKVDPQPLMLVVLLLIVTGVIVVIAVQNQLLRRAIVTVVAGLGAISLLANQIKVQALLRERIRAQVDQPLPPDKQIADYVHNQLGFWACLGTFVVLVMLNGVGWFRSANRSPG
jgi:hypothetical protein